MRALAVLAAVLALTACAPPAMRAVERADAVDADQVLVVGRVVLSPALHAQEQRFSAINRGQWINRMFLLTSEDSTPMPTDPSLSDFTGRIEATLGETFHVAADAKPFFVRGGVVFLDDQGGRMNKAIFPGGFRVDVQPGDRAIYIGTIEYRRDELFNILGVRIIDEFDRASRDYRQKFGPGAHLRRALLVDRSNRSR